jgi:hypothetical protein
MYPQSQLQRPQFTSVSGICHGCLSGTSALCCLGLSPVTPAAIHGDSRGRCDGGCDGPRIRGEAEAGPE